MAVFEYKAKDEGGNIFTGVYHDIESFSELREELEKLGYALVKARRRKRVSRRKGKIKTAEVVNFAYRFAGMCSAGLSIARCLQVLEEQTESVPFKNRIADIRQRVETGSSLKDAFGKHREVFSEFFLGMLEAGESGGKLSSTLDMAAVYLEKQADLRRQVKSSFAYPIIVGIMCVAIIFYLVAFVIPVFSKVYEQLHVHLPVPTLILMKLSIVVRRWWPIVLICGFGCVYIVRRLFKGPKWRAKWHAFKLHMPVLGKLNQMLVVSRFVRTFSMMASAGVPYLNALDVAKVVANNQTVEEIGAALQEKVEAGNAVAEAMSRYELFPPMIIQLAAAGEEAGILPEMLGKGVDFLDKDINRNINSLLVKLEPALTVFMGVIVGFILLGVYLPMFDYMSHLK